MPDHRDMEGPFDYIVVGGGTAGLTVASRLSEDEDVSVLVIEAGAHRPDDPLILTPGFMSRLYGKDEYDWNFQSVPQPNLHDRQIPQPRGRVLGGTSAINYMAVLYPSRTNIDAWGRLGNKGWSYDVLQPYYRKFGTTHEPPRATRDVVGLDYLDTSIEEHGPVKISFGEAYNAVHKAWVETFAQLGLEMTTDPRNGKAMGGFQNPASIDPETKTRSYAVTAYYTETVANRKNLVVLTETLVASILTERQGNEIVATGVRILLKDGQERTVAVNREVIVAAGALQSPQVLELSGIGDRAILEKFQIPVIIDNPNVGEHVQEHPMVTQSFEVKDGVPSADLLRDPDLLNAVIELYTKSKGGPMSQSGLGSAYMPLSDRDGLATPERKRAILDSHGSYINQFTRPAQEQEYGLLREMIMAHDEPIVQLHLAAFGAHLRRTLNAGLYSRPENFVTVITILNHPFSRGSCHIASADVKVKPDWDPRFNSHPLDLDLLASNVMFVEKFISTEPFKSLLKETGARMPEIVAEDMDQAREIVRQRQVCCFHVCGSCAMLPKESGGVVNERLVVHGTRNLRVVDASIFPLEPLGNIQSTVYAVAERAADIIKEDSVTADSTG